MTDIDAYFVPPCVGEANDAAECEAIDAEHIHVTSTAGDYGSWTVEEIVDLLNACMIVHDRVTGGQEIDGDGSPSEVFVERMTWLADDLREGRYVVRNTEDQPAVTGPSVQGDDQ